MGYFWVNQGATYAEERAAGLLWAPERTPAGGVLGHWETMTRICPGDCVFTYSSGALRGYATATSSAIPMARPYAAGAKYSLGQGGRAVFCSYMTVQQPVPLAAIQANLQLRTELQSQANPVLDVNGDVAQKYLCQISATAGAALAALVGGIAANAAPLPNTTVQRLADARVGQGQFRQDLLDAFGSRCALTGLGIAPLLRASHIRPWAVSDNQQRLDPNNGLLLAAGVDAAFDKGYIAFDPTGSLLVKSALSPGDLVALGIPSPAQLHPTHLHASRVAFLGWHRQFFGL